MYRCSECQKEYKEKIDYCDCGNDEFIYIEDIITSKKQSEPMSIEQKSQIISWIFFGVCVLLSLIVWLIPVKSDLKNSDDKVVIKTEADKSIKSMPNIDLIWDSTPPKIIKEEKPLVEEPNVKEVTEPISKPVVQPKQAKQSKQNVSKPVTKPSQQVQNKKQDAKPKENNKPKENIKPKSELKSDAKNQTVNNPIKPKIEEKVNKKEIKLQQPQKTYNPNSQAMLKYKGDLRAALFRKLPLGSIQGSGTCTVHFSVDANGKLINRGFKKQSDNKSLNDAVYYMMMSVPKFSAPPEEYSGEQINMTIKFHNGSYEITIN